MAPGKTAPASKKSAKAAKAAATSGEAKKKRKATRVETYNTYIYKVLKQVHPGTSDCWLVGPLRAAERRAALFSL